MHVEFDLPDEIAQALGSPDLSRAALEGIAAEGYRTRKLGNGQLRRILGFSTPMEVHEFLAERDIPLNYDIQDLEQDIETNRRIFAKHRAKAKRSA